MSRALGAFALVLTAVAGACTTKPPAVTHTIYQYSLAGPTEDLRAGQAVERSDEKARLCAALVGPFPTVADVKSSTASARTCPVSVPGTVVATGVAEADMLIGRPIDQQLLVPPSAASGYYQLISVVAFGLADTGNSMSGAGIVHVTAP
ncbi:MAG: hypothetical protein E6I64_06180 [Chloroflexi bacterium]|nr:MAG: hypothetical protein E6I64_06180 [Chloroflexota bacterium]